MPKRRKIAYITGTRADFGLMTPVLSAIKKSKKLSLQLYATGMHTMPEFGRTINVVRKYFPAVNVLPDTITTDDLRGSAGFVAQYIPRLIQTLQRDRPDFVLTLGDRAEMLATAVASLYLHIPTAHIHGGEKTSTVDDIARHAITKLSQIHFPATKQAAGRIRRMGEEPWRIHVVGAPAIDLIRNQHLPNRTALCKHLRLDPKKPFLLLTLHPVSQSWEDAARQMRIALCAVKSVGISVVATYPNADAGGRSMIRELLKEKNNDAFRIFRSLDYPFFLSTEREAAIWIGNSSAGIIESATFGTPVVDIGPRQADRGHGSNIVHSPYDQRRIENAIRRILTRKVSHKRRVSLTNPWGDGRSAQRIVKILETVELGPKLLQKRLTYV